MAKTMAEYEAENAALRAQLAKAQAPRALHCKVTEPRKAGTNGDTDKGTTGGAVSVYGLNAKFPVTLYPEQWERLIGFIPELQDFIKTNKPKLHFKNAA